MPVKGGWLLYIFSTFVLVLIVFITGIYNRLVRDRNLVLAAWSDIDIQLKRRYDLIPKLVAAVEQYARYEKSTLTTVIELRSQAAGVESPDIKGPLEGAIGSKLKKLIALAEAYPELKADKSFLQLQNDITEVENHIQYARRFYNGAVRNLNTRIETLPDLIVASLFHYQLQPLFELDSPEEKRSPEILNS
jgi:LemA protein